jgi:hypothetical protein
VPLMNVPQPGQNPPDPVFEITRQRQRMIL